jgi:hypothetical protein
MRRGRTLTLIADLNGAPRQHRRLEGKRGRCPINLAGRSQDYWLLAAPPEALRDVTYPSLLWAPAGASAPVRGSGPLHRRALGARRSRL